MDMKRSPGSLKSPESGLGRSPLSPLPEDAQVVVTPKKICAGKENLPVSPGHIRELCAFDNDRSSSPNTGTGAKPGQWDTPLQRFTPDMNPILRAASGRDLRTSPASLRRASAFLQEADITEDVSQHAENLMVIIARNSEEQ